jgi:hypothetical protein
MREENPMAIRVREFNMERDLPAVEDLERRCQVGLSGDQASPEEASTADDAVDGGGAKKWRRKKKTAKKQGMSLYVEQIGDPFARVRHSPDYVILVTIITCSFSLLSLTLVRHFEYTPL